LCFTIAAGEKVDEERRLAMLGVMKQIKEGMAQICTEHRELHSTVSKVGKSIDRVSYR